MWRRLILLSAVTCAASMKTEARTDSRQEVVVLLHGMGRTALSMKRIEWALAARGYRVVNVSYPSTRFGPPDLCKNHLRPALERIQHSSTGRVHFVTHSLGGVLLRQYLATHTVTNLGRVVMLGPPNRGSEVTDKFRRWWCYRLVAGPCGQLLGTGAEDLPRKLGPAHFEVGIIAGDRSVNPIFSRMLPGPDDGKVTVASTRLEGMSDFTVVHHSHTWMAWRKPVVRQVVAFLETGKFVRRKT